MNTRDLSTLRQQYEDFIGRHLLAEEDFIAAIEGVLTDAGLAFDRVSARVKQWDSLKTKALKQSHDTWLYPDPWKDIHDLVGVRVTTFHSTEIPQVIAALADTFQVIRSVDKTAEVRVSGGFGYGSHHLILEVDDSLEELSSYKGLCFEVQIRTVLQHAWAEFEHDIRYKRADGYLDPRVDRAFTLAAGLIELADQQFDQIAAIQHPPHQDESIALNANTLPGILAVLLGDEYPQSRLEDYQFLAQLLQAHGITSLGQLRTLLNPAAIDAVTRALKYQFQPGQVRIIDDVLLYRFRQEHIQNTQKLGNRTRQRHMRLRRCLETLNRLYGENPKKED